MISVDTKKKENIGNFKNRGQEYRHKKDPRKVLDLIGSTKTTTGLEVICVRDDTEYKLAGKVSDEEFGTISIVKIPPFESWNYKITPA